MNLSTIRMKSFRLSIGLREKASIPHGVLVFFKSIRSLKSDARKRL
jgi:hypothetical protein